MTATLDPMAGVAQALLRRYAPPAPPKPRDWASPGALAMAMDPSTVQTPALDLIDRELIHLMDNDDGIDRLIISMPPQEGKSVRVSQRFPEWLLQHDKDLRIAIVSYMDEMARRWGADIKQDVEIFNGEDHQVDLGITLRADSRAAGRWHIKGHKGGIYCVGIAGALTGKPVDFLIIDDPIKNMEQAQSAEYRERAKSFWRAVAVPRLGPGSKCVVIQTRWHEDDLSGWLGRQEPGQWRVVNIPAVAGVEHDVIGADGIKHAVWTEDPAGPDPLGRKPGQPMTSARGARNWTRIRQNVGEYVWSALYQGRPAPAAGGLFKRSSIRHWQPAPADRTRHGLMFGARVDLAGRMIYLDDCWRFATVDLAASLKTSADYTVAGAWAISSDGDLILLDGVRDRVEETDHWKLIRPLRERWSLDTVFVESRMFGTTLVYEAARSGVPVQELKADSDKLTRALPATVRADNGRLWLPSETAYPDVRVWVDELVSFPNAAHDDCVDNVAYAARVVAAHWVSQVDTESLNQMVTRSTDTAIENAYTSATGTNSGDTDYMGLSY